MWLLPECPKATSSPAGLVSSLVLPFLFLSLSFSSLSKAMRFPADSTVDQFFSHLSRQLVLQNLCGMQDPLEREASRCETYVGGFK